MNPTYVYADIFLALIVSVAAVLTSWQMTGRRRNLWRGVVSLGWWGLSLRYWIILWISHDIQISPVTIFFISLVAMGDIGLMLRKRA
jgi:hypothetical protein